MDIQNFRIAMRGFHRDDVVQFIEAKSLEHEKAIRAKNDEIDALQSRLAEQDALLEAARKQAEEQQKQIEELEKQIEELTAPEENLDAPIEPPANVLPATPSATQLNELELTAYRRAEMVERKANERANEVYRRVQSVFDASVTKLFETNQDLDTLAATMQASLSQLQAAVNGLCAVYHDTSAAFREVGTNDSEG